jgi:hypothetical protein
MSGAACVVVSCGVRLFEVGLSEIRKPQFEQGWEPQTGGFAKDTDRGGNCAHFVLNPTLYLELSFSIDRPGVFVPPTDLPPVVVPVAM